jgi:hypothetical protein
LVKRAISNTPCPAQHAFAVSFQTGGVAKWGKGGFGADNSRETAKYGGVNLLLGLLTRG